MRDWHFIFGLVAFSLGLYNFLLAIAFFATNPATQSYVIFGLLGSIAWIIASLISFIKNEH